MYTNSRSTAPRLLLVIMIIPVKYYFFFFFRLTAPPSDLTGGTTPALPLGLADPPWCPPTERPQTPGPRHPINVPEVAAGAQPANVDWELPPEKQQGSCSTEVLTGGDNKNQ